jgi:hypothetical protein
MRLIGDTVFTVGALAFAWFMAGLVFGWSHEPTPRAVASPADDRGRVAART